MAPRFNPAPRKSSFLAAPAPKSDFGRYGKKQRPHCVEVRKKWRFSRGCFDQPSSVGLPGRTLFPGMTQGDTPLIAVPAMALIDQQGKSRGNHTPRVVAVNTAGVHSVGTKSE
jgi:hypothetical protein